MSKVMVWKSDADGKLFEDKAKYTKHLRKLAAERQAQRKIAAMEEERESFIVQMGQVESIAALNKFIKDNWKWFWANGAKHEFYRWDHGKAAPFHEYVDVSILSTQWVENLSNSHSCPRTAAYSISADSSAISVSLGGSGGTGGTSGAVNVTTGSKVNIATNGNNSSGLVAQSLAGKGGNGGAAISLAYASGSGSTPVSVAIGASGGGGGTDYVSYSYDVDLWAADFPVMYEALRRSQYVDRENARRQREWRYIGGKGSVPLITEIPEDWTVPDPLVSW